MKNNELKGPEILDPNIEAEASEVIEEIINEGIQDEILEHDIVYDDTVFDESLEKIGETHMMDDKDYNKGFIKIHMTPIDKLGYLKVDSGQIKFIWEDIPNKVFTVDKDHPLVIHPGRVHKAYLIGPVKFKVEFYKPKNISEKSE